jgi:hypothetical protein
MTTASSKVAKAQDAIDQFLRPKLRRGFDFDPRPLFVGLNDRNVADHIDSIVGAVCRATSGDLASDAVVPELQRKLKEAVGDNTESKPSTKRAPNNPQAPEQGSAFEEERIAMVLELLRHRLLPTELMAVRELLLSPSTKSLTRHPDGSTPIKEDYAEDARLAFDRRYPDAKRIVVEPNIRPEQAPATASDPRAFFERYPGAARIGRA